MIHQPDSKVKYPLDERLRKMQNEISQGIFLVLLLKDVYLYRIIRSITRVADCFTAFFLLTKIYSIIFDMCAKTLRE